MTETLLQGNKGDLGPQGPKGYPGNTQNDRKRPTDRQRDLQKQLRGYFLLPSKHLMHQGNLIIWQPDYLAPG